MREEGRDCEVWLYQCGFFVTFFPYGMGMYVEPTYGLSCFLKGQCLRIDNTAQGLICGTPVYP